MTKNRVLCEYRTPHHVSSRSPVGKAGHTACRENVASGEFLLRRLNVPFVEIQTAPLTAKGGTAHTSNQPLWNINPS